MNVSFAIDLLGYTAQALFSARFFVQWIMSEKARRVLSPAIFWKISMAASCIFCIYGWLRNDFSIIIGQFITYYIYIWNLRAHGAWQRLWRPFRWLLAALPAIAVAWSLTQWQAVVEHLFAHEDLAAWLIALGTTGQIVFTLRFVYQWLYSRRAGESVLPVWFWVISLTGSSIIITYALLRGGMFPLILGHMTGVVVYARNVMIALKSRREKS